MSGLKAKLQSTKQAGEIQKAEQAENLNQKVSNLREINKELRAMKKKQDDVMSAKDEDKAETMVSSEEARQWKAEAQAQARNDALEDFLNEHDKEEDAMSHIPSEAPTEQLLNEYQHLMQEYEKLADGNKKMEQKVEDMTRYMAEWIRYEKRKF